MTKFQEAAKALCRLNDGIEDVDRIVGGVQSGLDYGPAVPAWTQYTEDVRAVLRAIREPSDAMRDAGHILCEGDSAPEASENCLKMWQAMIDALLAEGK